MLLLTTQGQLTQALGLAQVVGELREDTSEEAINGAIENNRKRYMGMETGDLVAESEKNVDRATQLIASIQHGNQALSKRIQSETSEQVRRLLELEFHILLLRAKASISILKAANVDIEDILTTRGVISKA